MKKIFILSLVVLLFACSKEQKSGEQLQTQKLFVTVNFIQGKVEKSADASQWNPVSLNDKIYVGEWIRTYEKSSVKLIVWTSSIVFLKANSLAQIVALDNGQKFELKLHNGSVSNTVEKITSDKGYYKVQGLALVAGVRGTEFDFTSDGQKDIVQVNKGSVAVKRNLPEAPEKILNEGEGTSASEKENQELLKKKGKLDIQVKKKNQIEKELKETEKNIEKQYKEILKQNKSVEEKTIMDKEMEKKSTEIEKKVEEKKQEIDKMVEKQSQKIQEMTDKKSQEIEKMKQEDPTEMSADDLLKKAKDKKKKQQ